MNYATTKRMHESRDPRVRALAVKQAVARERRFAAASAEGNIAKVRRLFREVSTYDWSVEPAAPVRVAPPAVRRAGRAPRRARVTSRMAAPKSSDDGPPRRRRQPLTESRPAFGGAP